MRRDNEVNVVWQPTDGKNRHNNDHHFHNLQTELNTFYHVEKLHRTWEIFVFLHGLEDIIIWLEPAKVTTTDELINN